MENIRKIRNSAARFTSPEGAVEMYGFMTTNGSGWNTPNQSIFLCHPSAYV
jgi:hypothetical protein